MIPLLEGILAPDPNNLDAALRLATSHSMLEAGRAGARGLPRAAAIAPRSPTCGSYLALHYARGKEWPQAVPMLEQDRRESPDRMPAVEALATVREKQGALAEAVRLRQQAYARRRRARRSGALGELAMQARQTDAAIAAFDRAPASSEARPARRSRTTSNWACCTSRRAGSHDARAALDRVPATHPDYAMALFKRAQVSVLLKEPDSGRAHRARAAGRRRHDAPADRPRAVVHDGRTETAR